MGDKGRQSGKQRGRQSERQSARQRGRQSGEINAKQSGRQNKGTKGDKVGNNVGDKVKDKVQTKRETKRGNKCETDWETKWGTKGAKWELGSAKVMALTSLTSWEQRMVPSSCGQPTCKQKQLQDAKMLQPGATPVRATLQNVAGRECMLAIMHTLPIQSRSEQRISMNSYELDKCP